MEIQENISTERSNVVHIITVNTKFAIYNFDIYALIFKNLETSIDRQLSISLVVKYFWKVCSVKNCIYITGRYLKPLFSEYFIRLFKTGTTNPYGYCSDKVLSLIKRGNLVSVFEGLQFLKSLLCTIPRLIKWASIDSG